MILERRKHRWDGLSRILWKDFSEDESDRHELYRFTRIFNFTKVFMKCWVGINDRFVRTFLRCGWVGGYGLIIDHLTSKID